MAKSQNRVEFQIGYSVDKSGLEQMQSMFQQIANKAQEPGKKITDGLKKAGETAATLDKILEKTFNSDLGTLNVTKFNQELAKSNLTLKDVKNNLVAEGNLGATAYNKLTQAILGTNQQLKQSNQLLDNMAKSFKNVLTWGVASSVFNTVTASIQNAYSYAKQLNSSLNDIRIVTDKSAESMEKFAIQANNAAKNLGASTLDYSNAALIYYQQGLSDEEAKARAETTVKAANITGQTGEAVSEQLTAVWNGYKVSAEETELYVDKLAAVAATTAADLEELSVGMSKVASAASTMGVDFDDLNAQMATIVSVTRQAPESVGTALKTIYARLGDLKVDGVDEFGVKLGEVTKNLQTMGIEILDEEGNMRDMTSVMAEVAEKWNTWTEAQKQAAAIAMAGKRQYNNLMALFENWDMYSKALETSADAMGTLQHQQDIYMESTAAKLKTLKATWQDLYDGLADDNEINAGIEALTNIVQVFDNFIDSFGGGLKSIAGFGTFVAQIFNKQIAGAINEAVQRQAVFKQNLELAKTKANVIGEGVGELGRNASPIQKGIQAGAAEEMKYAQKIYDLRAGLNQEQYTTLTNYQHEIGELTSIIAKNEAIMENRKASTGLTEQEVKSLRSGISYVDTLNERYENVGNNVNKINSELKEFNSIQKSANKETLMNSFNDEGIKRIKESITALFTSSGEGAFNKSIQDSILQEERFKKVLDDIQAGTFNINTQERDLKDLIDKATAAQEKQNKATGQYVKALQEANEAKEQKNNVKMETDQMLSAAEKASDLTNKVVALTSTVSTLTMAWSSLNSVIQTWNDENASFNDKIFQTLTTGAMAVPMLINSIKQMNETLGVSSFVIDIVNTQKEKNRILQEKEIALNELEKAQSAQKIAIEKKEMAVQVAVGQLQGKSLEQKKAALVARTQEILASKAEIASMDEESAKEVIRTHLIEKRKKVREDDVNAIYAGIVAKKADTAAEAADTAAKTADAAATGVLTKATYALNAAFAANPIGAIVTALVAIVTVTAIAAAGIDAVTVSAEEAKEQLNKSSESLKETTQEIETLNQELETTKERIEELKNLDKISLVEEEELNNLTAQNALLEAQIRAKKELQKLEQEKMLRDAKQSAESGSYDMKSIFTNTALESTSSELTGFSYKKYSLDQLDYDNLDDFKNAITEKLNLALSDYNTALIANNGNESTASQEAQIAINYYKDLLDNFGTRFADPWIENLEKMQESYDDLQEKRILPSFYENNTDESGFYDDDNADRKTIQYYEDFNLKYYKAAGAFPEMAQKAVDAAFKSTDEINNIQNNFGKILKEDTHTIDEEAFINSLGENGEETFSNLQKMAQQYQISVYDLLVGIRDYGIQVSETIEEVMDPIEAQKAKVEENLNFVNTAIADIGKNGKLSKKELENMSESLDALEDQYIELASIQDRESTLYYNKLLEIREALEEQQILYKKQEENDLIDKAINIEVKADDDSEKELQETLKAICEADYEVLVNIKADTQDDFDNTVNALDRINDMASKIGENFVVSAADIEELNDVFPGILDNMELVGDGTIKLNEEVVKGAQETAKAEIAADTDVTVQKLQNQISDLEMKRDTAKRIATIAGKLAKDEGDTETNLSDLRKELDNLQTENSETVAENEQQDEIDTAKVASQAAFDMDNAYNNAYQNMSKNAVEWAAIAHQSLLYASYEDATPAIDTYSGISTQTTSNVARIQSEKGEIKSSDEVTEDLDYAAVEKYYDNLSKAYDETINEYYGKIAELVARGQGAAYNMDNLGSGKDKSGGKDKKNKEHINDEIDYLHKYKKVIESTEIALKRLDKTKEGLKGKNYISALNKENDLLKKENQQYTELIKATKKVASVEKGSLTKLGAIFDENNNISNYAEIQQQFEDSYNAAIDAYNNSAKTEMDEHLLNIAKQTYDENKKLLDSFEGHVKDINDYIDKRKENRLKKIKNNLTKFETKIQIKIDEKELNKNLRKFNKELNKNITKTYSDYSKEVTYNKGQFEDTRPQTNTRLKEIERIENEIDILKSGGKSKMFDTLDLAQEKLKEVNESMESSALELEGYYEDAWKAYIDGIDQAKDKYSELQKEFERASKELEYQGQVIELVYGEEAYDLLNDLYEGQRQVSLNRIESLKSQVDTWSSLLEGELEKVGKSIEDIDPGDMLDWDEDEKKYYENWKEAQSELFDETINNLEVTHKIYENMIESIGKQLEKSLTNGAGFDALDYEWERITRDADRYYDSIEKTYEIQTLANKWDKEIASTKELKTQQKLKKLRDDMLKQLREKEKLSEYDVKYAELEYQLELKRIALEESQNNKTSMKLTRNAEGNWSYQYVANEDDLKDKQQDYLDTWHEMHELTVEAQMKNEEDVKNITKQYLENVKAAHAKYGGRVLNKDEQEEYDELLRRYKEDYLYDIDKATEDSVKYRTNLQITSAGILTTVYEQNKESYEGLTENEKTLLDGLKENYLNTYSEIEAGIIGNINGIGTQSEKVASQTFMDWDSNIQKVIQLWDKDNGESLTNKIDQAYKDFNLANKQFIDNLHAAEKASGDDFGEEGVKGDIDKVVASTIAATKATLAYSLVVKTQLPKMSEEVDTLAKAWKKIVKKINNANKKLGEYLQSQDQIKKEITVEIKTKYTTEGTPSKYSGGDDDSNGGGTSPVDTPSISKGRARDNGYALISNPKGSGGPALGLARMDEYNNIKEYVKMGDANNKTVIKNDKKGRKKYVEENIPEWVHDYAKNVLKFDSFATGGYTGTWGDDEGRLAMLHQKELVLNAEDTENLLSGISMIRDMSSLNGSINNSILKAISNMMLSLSGINTGLIGGATTDNSSSNTTFNITAEFPNAENVNDIREAILSLPNLASQFKGQRLK